jgi:hypothetical protein
MGDDVYNDIQSKLQLGYWLGQLIRDSFCPPLLVHEQTSVAYSCALTEGTPYKLTRYV